MIPVRKGGKLPVETESVQFIDYSGATKSLEIRKDSSLRNVRTLLIDEWIETGAQVTAAIRLIENQGGIVVGIATISIDLNERTFDLRNKFTIHSLQNGQG